VDWIGLDWVWKNGLISNSDINVWWIGVKPVRVCVLWALLARGRLATSSTVYTGSLYVGAICYEAPRLLAARPVDCLHRSNYGS